MSQSQDVIEMNGKQYTIKHYLTVKEVRELIKREQHARLEYEKGNFDPIFELWADILGRCLGVTVKELEDMHYRDAERLYLQVIERNKSIPL
ncbi:MAG: phage tail assembly protein [Candidatus Nitrosocaldus sp.]